jgi:hypothetical protein
MNSVCCWCYTLKLGRISTVDKGHWDAGESEQKQ